MDDKKTRATYEDVKEKLVFTEEDINVIADKARQELKENSDTHNRLAERKS